MGLIRNKVSIPASGFNSNVLAGSSFELVQEECMVEVALLGSAAGLTASVSSGTDILLEDGSAIDVVRVAGQGPIYPDDFALTDYALPGDRLRVAVRNPTAGALDLYFAVRTTPI